MARIRGPEKAVREKICRHVVNGVAGEVAAATIGIDAATFRQWLKDGAGKNNRSAAGALVRELAKAEADAEVRALAIITSGDASAGRARLNELKLRAADREVERLRALALGTAA